MATVDNALPGRPRLRTGCRVLEDPEGLVVRSVGGAFRISRSHCDAMRRILARLDGTRELSQLLDGERTEDAFYALRMLHSFAQSGLLAEGPVSADEWPGPPAEAPPMDFQGARLRGARIAVLDGGLLADALGRSLESLGATVLRGGFTLARACGAIAISCPDGPDLASLEASNEIALKTETPWLQVFPFGDGIITGPLVRSPEPPCLRCFELRWLGISPSIALELLYFAHLRGGAFREGAVSTAEEAARLAALVAPLVAGRLAAPASASRVALTRPELGTTTEAPLEPHPHCSSCARSSAHGAEPAPAPAAEIWTEPPVALAELAPGLAELAGEPCGLAWVAPPPRHARTGRPGPLQVAVSRFALPEPEEVGGGQDNWSHGAAEHVEEARTLAIVEALERYNGLSPPAPGIWASYASVASGAILPTELPLFSDTQYARPGFPFQPFDPERPVRWNWGYNLTRKRPVLIPTSAAWYGYDDHLLGECSNGVAAHSSRGHALLNGILEVAERDAFMIHWLHRLSPPRIEPGPTLGDRSRAILRSVEEDGYAVRILDLTTDLGIPVALAAGFREDRRKPALIVGAGASLAARTAVERALSELYAATLSPTELWTLKPPLDPSEVRTLADHSRAYEHPDWLPHASFLWASTRRTALAPPRPGQGWLERLHTLIARLEGHGHDVVGVDLTGADLARHRLFVVRAIVPGLQPLALGSGGRLGGRRLYEAPVRMGYRDALPQEEHLNPVPHCFP